MEQQSVYNNYTKKMLQEFEDLGIKPKSGKSIRFQLSGVYTDKVTGRFVCPTSHTVLPFDRINNEDGEPIDIAYIINKRPLGPNSQRAEEIVMGEIAFTRGNYGMFEWFGEPATKELAKYLYFCNYNESNREKYYHIPPPTYIFKIVGDGGAKEQLGRDREIDKAYARIEEIAANPQTMMSVKMGMFPNEYARFTDEQIIIKLRAIAAKTPEKILALSKGPDLKAVALVNKIIKESLVKVNQNEKTWEYPDGRTICQIPEDKTEPQALKEFFATEEGKQVLAILVEQLPKDEKPAAKAPAEGKKKPEVKK